MSKLYRVALSCAIAVLMAATASSSAYALAPGCSSEVSDAQKAMANARINADVGMAEEIIKKPGSVLVDTCFSKSAQNSAQQAGEIFSGDFSSEIQPIIEEPLTDWLSGDNFLGSIIENIMPSFGFEPLGGGGYECDRMAEVWDASLNNGMNTETPFVSIEDLIAGTVSGGGDNLLANLGSGTFGSNLGTTMGAVTPGIMPDYSGSNGVCDVYAAMGMSCY